jgi:hypothetical protein
MALLFPRMLASCNPVDAIRKMDVVAMCSSVIPEYLDVFPSDFLNVALTAIFSVLFDILNSFQAESQYESRYRDEGWSRRGR